MSYSDYFEGLRDGIHIGFKAGVEVGYKFGRSTGYLDGYEDGYKDRSYNLPFNPCELNYKIDKEFNLLLSKPDPKLFFKEENEFNFLPLNEKKKEKIIIGDYIHYF